MEEMTLLDQRCMAFYSGPRSVNTSISASAPLASKSRGDAAPVAGLHHQGWRTPGWRSLEGTNAALRSDPGVRWPGVLPSWHTGRGGKE